jgi:two-component system LytT family sensor kinase
MEHPILKNKRSILIYVAIWAAIIVLSILGSKTILISYKIAIINTITFSGLFALLGIPIWYMVLYSNIEKSNILTIVLNHVTGATIVVFIWLMAGYLISTALLPDELMYPDMLNAKLPQAILFGFTLYAIYVLVYYLNIYYSNLKEKKSNENSLLAKIKEAELSLLKAQINPHFLFNSLNSISSLTITNPSKAQEMIIKLSDFLRYSITGKNNQKSTLKTEMENIQRYLDIEKVRFGNKLNFVQDIPQACFEKTLPVMILQPLFENAVKHGVYESTDEVTLSISCTCEGGFLHIVMRNNFDTDFTSHKGAGIGLQNIRERLRLIYYSDNLLKTSIDKNIFEVKLLIPQDNL